MDDLLAEADECIRPITNELKRVELAAQEDFVKLEQQQKLRFERELTKQRVLQKKETDAERRKLDFEYQQKLKDARSSSSSEASSTVKMPKLVITKFDRTPRDSVLGVISSSNR